VNSEELEQCVIVGLTGGQKKSMERLGRAERDARLAELQQAT